MFRDMKTKYLCVVMFGSCSGIELSVLTSALMKYYKHCIINAKVYIILKFYVVVIDVTIRGEVDCLYYFLFYFLFLIIISLLSSVPWLRD
jgi:hypothetical protein